ncbi:hypothetical protein BEI_2546 [Halomonas beimenensis]|uniref:Short-chain dehydrogenase/reductase SDR n=2 Tax=Halomonas beimenensis TaxID=475662 RepID=A0A291P9E8_9GAMM|nr:hypothetical protein BEI_2546 [Halomonas beimenensis]
MGKRALIVGASGGIGRGIAGRLAADGWHILAQGRRSMALNETLEAVRQAGGEGQTFEAELDDMSQVAALAAWAREAGPLQAVIWSAGGGRSVATGPEAIAEWERTLATALHAPMQLAAHTLASLQATQGAYLFVCGMYAKMGVARMAAHCAARHGLEGFAKALFEEVRESGVGVTLIHPGFVHSRLTASDRLDPAKMIRVADIAETVAMALALSPQACVTELTVRPQRSPYRPGGTG